MASAGTTGIGFHCNRRLLFFQAATVRVMNSTVVNIGSMLKSLVCCCDL
jgi:hypothetical protein